MILVTLQNLTVKSTAKDTTYLNHREIKKQREINLILIWMFDPYSLAFKVLETAAYTISGEKYHQS